MRRVEVFLRQGRRAAERRMVDTCRIDRKTGTTRDDESGTIIPTFTKVYEGKCRMQQAVSGQANEQDQGQDRLLLLRTELQLPIPVINLKVGDTVVMLSSLDPDLVARVFTIRDLAHKTEATARRVQCTERTGS